MTRASYRVRFAGGCGFELAGIVERAADAVDADDASRCVAVFSHCFTCSKDLKAVVRISRGLADRGVTVLRYDMTGLGGSDGDFSQTNFSTNLEDLRAAVRFARQELGPVTAWMGHSFGGAASLALASGHVTGGNDGDGSGGLEAERFDDLRCVITLAAPSDTTHLAQLLTRMNPAIEAEGVGEVTIGGVAWTIRQQMLDDFRSHELPALISRIRLPLLLFHSPEDRTVGFDQALRIMTMQSSAVGSDHSPSLVVLPGADHLLAHSPRDIDFVASVAAAFIRRHAAGASDDLNR